MSRLTPRALRVGAACLAQLALVAVAVAGPLSARLVGDEYLLEVAPVDPIDPFRGAYVALGYPGLNGGGAGGMPPQEPAPGERGEVFVPLVREGDLWRGGSPTRTRPEDGPYLRCDDTDWQRRCGIESWFLPQDKAIALERAVSSGSAVARVRVDGRGNAALVGVEVSGAG
jgi:uncharacterized membrane-anchored protein